MCENIMISVKCTYLVMKSSDFNCDLTSIGINPNDVECKSLAEANRVRDELRKDKGIYLIKHCKQLNILGLKIYYTKKLS